jgi:hypothetical protein
MNKQKIRDDTGHVQNIPQLAIKNQETWMNYF